MTPNNQQPVGEYLSLFGIAFLSKSIRQLYCYVSPRLNLLVTNWFENNQSIISNKG